MLTGHCDIVGSKNPVSNTSKVSVIVWLKYRKDTVKGTSERYSTREVKTTPVIERSFSLLLSLGSRTIPKIGV